MNHLSKVGCLYTELKLLVQLLAAREVVERVVLVELGALNVHKWLVPRSTHRQALRIKLHLVWGGVLARHVRLHVEAAAIVVGGNGRVAVLPFSHGCL